MLASVSEDRGRRAAPGDRPLDPPRDEEIVVELVPEGERPTVEIERVP